MPFIFCVHFAKLPPRIVYLCRLIHLPRKNTFLFSIATTSVTPRILCSFKASACPWNWVEQARQCRQDSVRLEASTHSEIQLEFEQVAILGWVGYKCFTTVSHLNHPKWKVCTGLTNLTSFLKIASAINQKGKQPRKLVCGRQSAVLSSEWISGWLFVNM